MTDHDHDVESARRDRPAAKGRDASEIEVTPEMLDTGVDCFYDLPELLGPTEERLRDTPKTAFLRMLRAHRVSREKVPGRSSSGI